MAIDSLWPIFCFLRCVGRAPFLSGETSSTRHRQKGAIHVPQRIRRIQSAVGVQLTLGECVSTPLADGTLQPGTQSLPISPSGPWHSLPAQALAEGLQTEVG